MDGTGLRAACVLVDQTDKKPVNPDKVTEENPPFWESGVKECCSKEVTFKLMAKPRID